MAVSKLLADSLEDNVLTMLCWDETAAPIVAMQVAAELFSTREYQRVAQFALDHIARYGVPPRGHLRDYLEGEMRRRDGNFLRTIIDAMEALHPQIQRKFVQDHLDRFIAERQMAMSLDTAYDRLDKGDLEGARDALYSASTVVKPTTGVFLHDTENWLTFLKRKASEFSSGIGIFNERGVRPARGELYLHIGSRKSGKTWALIQIGREAVFDRHDVLHVTLENSAAVTRQRYTQSFLQLTTEQARTITVPTFERDDRGRLTMGHLPLEPGRDIWEMRDQNETVLGEMLRPHQWKAGSYGGPGRLYVQEYPTGTLTVAQLNNLLDYLERTESFKPGLIIVDYINLMQIGDVRQHRLSLGRLGVELRGLGVQRDAAIVTATQGNRQSADAKLVTGKHVAEDWSLVGTADTVVCYSQTTQENASNVARMYVDAARNVADKWKAWIAQAYPIGQFCLDSTYMDRASEAEMARHFAEDEETERRQEASYVDADEE